MTSAERAKETVGGLFEMVAVNGSSVALAKDLACQAITQAITSAQNDKLEEARQRILEGHDEACGNPAEQHAWDQAAQRIEALKSKDTP